MEFAFLGKGSVFRQSLSELFSDSFLPNPFDYLPELSFESDDLYSDGKVEFLKLDSENPKFSKVELEGLGSVLALLCWFGVGDLHYENLLIGRSKLSNKAIFAPIDIESIFEDVNLPSQSLLIPSDKIEPNKTPLGLFIANEWKHGTLSLDHVAALCRGYALTLRHLEQSQKRVIEILLNGLCIERLKIRVIPRSTKEYYQQLGDTDSPLLFDCEKEQLARGDIPYYFSSLLDPKIFYYKKSGTAQSNIQLGVQGIHFLKLRLLESSNTIDDRSSFQTLLEGGIAQLMHLFVKTGKLIGLGTWSNTMISSTNHRIKISVEGLKLQCRV